MANTPKKLTFSKFVSEVVKDPKTPVETLLLHGYVGESSEAGHTRLYFDPQLSSYAELPDDAILHSQEIPAAESPLGGTYVWIKRDAQVIHGQPAPARQKGTFLEGPLMAGANIPPPSAPIICLPTLLGCPHTQLHGCPPPTPPVLCQHPTPLHGCPLPTAPTQCCPPPTPPVICQHPTPLHGCHITPLHGCPITPLHGCPPQTPLHGCPPPTLPVVCQHPTPFCPPPLTLHCTIAPQCHTLPQQCFHTPVCPIQTVICPVQTAFCPVQTLACPSAVDACPSAPGGCGFQTIACGFQTVACGHGGFPGGIHQ